MKGNKGIKSENIILKLTTDSVRNRAIGYLRISRELTGDVNSLQHRQDVFQSQNISSSEHLRPTKDG